MFDRRDLFALVVLCCVAAAAWSRTLSFGFVYDDHAGIEQNSHLQSWRYLFRLLTEPVWAQRGIGPDESYYYRPVFSLWLFAQWMAFHARPFWWHLMNVLLYAAAAAAVYLLVRSLTLPVAPALCAALLFTLHPAHTEVVSCVSDSCEMLFATMLLLALACLLHSRDAPPTTRMRWYVASLALYLASLFTKETGLFLLPLFCGVALVSAGAQSNERPRPRVLWVSGYIAGAFVYLLLRLIAFRGNFIGRPARSLSEVLLTAPSLALFYLGKLVLPMHLGPFYDAPVIRAFSVAHVLVPAILLMAGTAALFLTTRHHRPLWIGAVLVVLPILAALFGLHYLKEYDAAHDRYLFLPSAGLALIFGSGLYWLREHTGSPRLLYGSTSAALALLLLPLPGNARIYRDDLSMMRRGTVVAPHNVFARDLLANVELRRGDTAGALADYETAQRLRPDLWSTNFPLGLAYARAARPGEAEQMLLRAASLPAIMQPEAILTWYELGKLRAAQGNRSGAEAAFIRGLALDPGSAALRAAWSRAHFAQQPQP